MNILKNVKISQAIVLVAVIPLVVFVVYAVAHMLKEQEKIDELSSLNDLTELSVIMSNLVHEQQKERGATAGYLGSKGKKFYNELVLQRSETNKIRQFFLSYMNIFENMKYEESFQNKVEGIVLEVKRLTEVRKQVDSFSISTAESIEYFSNLNANILDVISSLALISRNSEVSNHIHAYINFMKSKELSGIERAIGSGAFATKKNTKSTWQDFKRIIVTQDNYLSVFLSIATEEQKKFYQDTLNGMIIKDIEHMRQIAFDSPDNTSEVEATSWFKAITMKINLLKKVENKLEEDLRMLMNQVKKEAQDDLKHDLNAIMASFFATVILLFFIIRMINKIFLTTVNAITQLSGGNLKVKLPEASGQESSEIVKALKFFKESGIKQQKLSAELKKHKDNLEDEVERRTLELVSANAELEEFAYRTSHDLRSPLMSSLGLLDLTKISIEEKDYDTALDSVGHIRTSLSGLESLVQDILSLTKIKNEEEAEQEIDVAALVNNTLQKIDNMENFDRLKIETKFAHKGKVLLKSNRFVMIVDNLISNAVKYQDINKGNSFVEISTYEKGKKFVFEVRDNGLGISKEHQEHLFAMFKRFHNNVSSGSGLGLYMIKKSAEILGGKIVFDDPGDGSIFRLEVPIKKK